MADPTRTHVVRRAFFAGLVLGIRTTWPILSALVGLMLGFGLVIGHMEGWPLSEGIYFAFVTGLTVGYGDLAPKLPLSRMLSVAIGFTGILLTGLIAAISVHALQAAIPGLTADADE